MSTLTVSTIQTTLHWEDKAANMAMLEGKIIPLRGKTELVVLPEMFTTGFSMRSAELAEEMDGPTVSWMKRVAAENRVILAGSFIAREGSDFYNRLVWMLPTGQYGIYDKRHRFGYGDEDQYFTAGNKRLIASVKGWKVNTLICYDLRFPVWARQQTPGEYDLLLYVANWPERRSHAWRTLLTARAIENQSYVIGVNRVGDDGKGLHYSGDTMIVGPLGEIIYHQQEVEDVFTVTLKKSDLDDVRSQFPFLKDADHFSILPD